MIKEIDLRILTFIECEKKMQKITEILNFFNTEGISTHLSMLYDSEEGGIRSENLFEHPDAPSLSIDLRDELFRFKYWNGAKTYWTYHTDDLFRAIDVANTEYNELYEKYSSVTELLFNWRDDNKDKIYTIKYLYYPEDNVDVEYKIIFESNMKDNPETDIFLKDIFKSINDKFDNLSMTLEYEFKRQCTPCEERRKQNESNKENNGQ